MTYIEWRDELAGYLTGLSDAERKRIFDYYSEMYADKRDLGRSEKDVIADFGAPYDVAQKILSDGCKNDKPPEAAPVEPVILADEDKDGSKAKVPKGNGKKIFAAVMWAILGLIILCWMCSQFAQAFEQIANAVYSFKSGDGSTGIVAVGYTIMHIGFAVILACLCEICAKKTITIIKKIREKY